MVAYLIVLAVCICAFIFIARNFRKLRAMDEGTEDMADLAGIIRSAARTFMRAEYKIIIPVVLLVAAIISVFIEKTSGLTFITGATMSSLACIIGMRSATYANVRTTATAIRTKSIVTIRHNSILLYRPSSRTLRSRSPAPAGGHCLPGTAGPTASPPDTLDTFQVRTLYNTASA